MKNVLIIAYYYYPFQGVGAKRASYWGRNLSKVADDIECTIITATKQNEKICDEEIIYIEATSKVSLLNFLIKDEGLMWLGNLKKYFKNIKKNKKYDVVIITGGPFFHFSIAKFLKKMFNSKIILDFRDPFSSNPRYNNNYLIKVFKKALEIGFVKSADIVITVNKSCERLISGSQRYSSKFKIIENGYDDVLVDEIKKIGCFKKENSSSLKIIYAGTFYNDVNTDNFINVITQKDLTSRVEFIHVGKERKGICGDNVKSLGVRSYKETLQLISSSDICLIITGGKDFESTTKIFDYLAFNKIILVITGGEIKSGNINEILRKTPNVYWAYNEVFDINRILKIIIEKNSNDKTEYPTYEFSRLNGLYKLLEIIKLLCY